jgi:hypothetical protein
MTAVSGRDLLLLLGCGVIFMFLADIAKVWIFRKFNVRP